ncbi:hypothetical protein MASR2M66_11910 [Chloroflexota bacterium]
MNFKNISVLMSVTLAFSVFTSTANAQVSGTSRHVSRTGVDAGTCAVEAPCKTFAYAMKQSAPGDTIHAEPGNYPVEKLARVGGSEGAPITLDGNGAVSAGFILDRVNWIVIENFNFDGNDVIDITAQSHFITVRENTVKFGHAGLYVRGFSSHILVENNEFYQTCAKGLTWTQVKGSDCEGGAFYGSSYGGGSYYIHDNYVHDVFNAFLFTDDADEEDDEYAQDDSSGSGEWMNSNVFIYGNRISTVMDDVFEPEGDSFNIHFYNNIVTEAHRMASLTTAATGPVFIYGNYQRTFSNPTHEDTRENSMLKLDFSEGSYDNGVWVFNNTVFSLMSEIFYPLDMLSDEVSNLYMMNNIFNTTNPVVNSEPIFSVNTLFDFNITRSGFGYPEKNGLQTYPFVKFNGTLMSISPAVKRSTEIDIPGYFLLSPVVPSGTDAGAFSTYSAPVWVMPPGGYPTLIPANIESWQG